MDGITVTITGTFEPKTGDELRDVMDCINEAIEKLREQGSADGTVKVSGEVEVKL